MSRLYKTEGIVLKHSYIGEADALITVYTPSLGKLRAVARGATRPKSRLGGHLEPLTHCAMMLAEGRSIDVVSGCDSIDAFMPLRANLWLMSCGLYAADLTDRLGAEGAENRVLFRLLLNTLQSLSAGIEPAVVLRYFELRSLACSGYLPELWKCVACNASIEPGSNYFSPGAGGLLCPDCGPKDGLSRTISVDGIKVLRFFSRHEQRATAKLRLKPFVMRELEDLMRGCLVYVLDREVKSASWLRRLQVVQPATD
jgi:DNA repair protein RecO (recombination protein O)